MVFNDGVAIFSNPKLKIEFWYQNSILSFGFEKMVTPSLKTIILKSENNIKNHKKGGFSHFLAWWNVKGDEFFDTVKKKKKRLDDAVYQHR